MAFLILLTLSFLTLIVTFYVYLKKNYEYWKDRNVPGPEPSLLVGNFPSIYNRKLHFAHEFAKIYDDYKGKTPAVGIFRGTPPSLMILDPDLVKQIMITNFSHFTDTQSGEYVSIKRDPVFARNPFFLNGDLWRKGRLEAVPGFSTGRVKALWPVLQNVFQRMENYIDQEMKEYGSLAHRSLFSKYTLDVVGSAIYGIDVDAFNDSTSQFATIAPNVLAPKLRNTLIMIMGHLFPSLVRHLKITCMSKSDTDFMTQLLRDTMKYRKDNNIQRQDFVDHLMDLSEKRRLEEVELVGHTAAFYFDGVATSSLAMSNCFYELAKQPQYQDKLREAVRAAKGPNGFDYDTVMDLEYLNFVVTETLRLHPIMPAYSRACSKDFVLELPDRKVTISKGTAIWLPVLKIHTDPEFYEDAARFNPDRYNDGNMKWLRDKCVLMPFGEGPRTCMGQRYALAQTKSCIVNIIDKYEVTLTPFSPEKLTYNSAEIILGAYKEKVYLKFNKLA